MVVYGVKLIGINAHTGEKLLFSFVLFAAFILVRFGAGGLIQLALRFVAPAHGARELKDAMSRDILRAFDASGIGIASATYDIVGMPPLRTVSSEPRSPDRT